VPLVFEHQYASPGFDSAYVTIDSATFNGSPVAVSVPASGQRTSINFNWLWFFSVAPASGAWPAGTGTLAIDGALWGKGADTGTSLGFSDVFNNTTFDGTPPTIDMATVNGLAKATTSPSVQVRASGTDDCGVHYAATPGTTTLDSMYGLPGPHLLEVSGVPTADTLPLTLQVSDCVGNTTSRTFQLAYAPAATSGVQALSKDGDTLFTGSTDVDLHVYGPKFASEMLISNEGSFPGASWQPYDWNKPWTITKLGTYTLPRTVYVKFKLADGTETGALSDDIVYDPLTPVLQKASLDIGGGSASVSSNATLRVKAKDRGPSGLGKLQIKKSRSNKHLTSMKFKKKARVPLGKHMWARVVDNAGNPSKWKKLR
jgi:hypothetical protein